MLLGKYYEDKQNKQFIHQYYNSSYRARATAIERAQRIKNSDSEKMIFDALNDPFWNIRVLAIEAYNKVKNELDNQATIQIKKLAREDPKPQVRSASLTYLASLPKEEASELMKFVLINEKSYNVISTALVTLKKINPESALISARDLQKEENTTLNT